MSIALGYICTLLVISLGYAVLLIREYLRVTKKRRELIAVLGGSGRAVPRWKNSLMTTYVASTVGWSVGFLLYFFWIQ